MTVVTVPELGSPSLAAENRVLLEGISWSLYERLLRELGRDNPGVRLAYDDGRLEIMSPTPLHEDVKKITARLIEAYGDERGLTVQGLGSTTFKRKDLKKGLEPDECYYVANAARVIGKKKLDLLRDPPPDLAIEVDISPPQVLRPPIYAALGVPEIWRFDGERLAVLLRTEGGDYQASETSLSFPELPMREVNRFLRVGLESGQSAAVRALRQWLRG